MGYRIPEDGRGVGSNSVQCTNCQKLFHRKCSGIKGNMVKVSKCFACRDCRLYSLSCS